MQVTKTKQKKTFKTEKLSGIVTLCYLTNTIFNKNKKIARHTKTQESVTHAQEENSQWKLSKWVPVLDLARNSKMLL